MAPKSPKTVTIYGRLSFPVWTAQEAFTKSQGSKFPAKSVAEAKPAFELVVEQAQFDKLKAHVIDVFLPYCEEQGKKGEKKDAIEAKDVKRLLSDVNGDLADQICNTPFKPVGDKTADLAPESVATVKCIGSAGVDMELKAIVAHEDELVVPDPDQKIYPVIKPINQTVHSMYPGCYVAATLNLYAYYNGKNPGFSAGANVAIFKAEGDRFGGGVAIDEDEIFAD